MYEYKIIRNKETIELYKESDLIGVANFKFDDITYIPEPYEVAEKECNDMVSSIHETGYQCGFAIAWTASKSKEELIEALSNFRGCAL